MVLHNVTIDEHKLASYCEQYGVERVWLFGSILDSAFRADSDVDVLVELSAPIGLFRLGGLQADLSALFGRDVHLTTLNSVPERIRQGLLNTARLEYSANAIALELR
jgi:predicted nucleotidyltransferase